MNARSAAMAAVLIAAGGSSAWAQVQGAGRHEHRDRRTVAVGGSLVLAQVQGAGRHEHRDRRTIEATGVARLSAPPDRLRLVVSVETRATTANAATVENAAVSAKVVERLETIVGTTGEIATRAYDLRAEYEYVETNGRRQRQLIGYLTTSTVEVRAANLESAGPIIDAAVGAGASGVRSVNFYLNDEADLRREALIQAGREARARAKAIASSLGVELGPLLRADDDVQIHEPPRPTRARAAFAAEGGVPTQIEPGEVEISMRVHAIFEVR